MQPLTTDFNEEDTAVDEECQQTRWLFKFWYELIYAHMLRSRHQVVTSHQPLVKLLKCFQLCFPVSRGRSWRKPLVVRSSLSKRSRMKMYESIAEHYKSHRKHLEISAIFGWPASISNIRITNYINESDPQGQLWCLHSLLEKAVFDFKASLLSKQPQAFSNSCCFRDKLCRRQLWPKDSPLPSP